MGITALANLTAEYNGDNEERRFFSLDQVCVCVMSEGRGEG